MLERLPPPRLNAAGPAGARRVAAAAVGRLRATPLERWLLSACAVVILASALLAGKRLSDVQCAQAADRLRGFAQREARAVARWMAHEGLQSKLAEVGATARLGMMQAGLSVDGVELLSVTLPVPGSDLHVAVDLPWRDVDGGVSRALAWIGVGDALLLLLAAAVVKASMQRRALRHAADRQHAQDARLRALRLLDDIADSSTDGLYARDVEGRVLFANREICRLLGRPVGDVVGRHLRELLPADQAGILMRTHRGVLETGAPMAAEIVLFTADGERTLACTETTLRDARGDAAGVCGTCRDVTLRRREETERRQWAMAFQSTRDGVLITDTANRILAVNQAFSRITGYPGSEVLGSTPALLRSGRHDAAFYRDMWHTLRQAGNWQGEVWNRRRNGEIYPELLTISAVRDDDGRVVNYVGVFTDLSRLRRSEEQLEQLAHHDALTNLPNRRGARQGLERAISQAARHGGGIAVLSIDLDDFRTVNDSLGHPVGDELLVCVASRLAACLREGDRLARLGGDEFLIVMERVAEATEAAATARDVLEAVAAPIPVASGREAYVTASVGISMAPADGGSSAVELMRDADAAMYSAKAQGHNRFCFYTDDLNVGAVAKLDLEAGLCRAIPRGELELHYQPKMLAGGGGLAGVEALLRWRRQGELVAPGRFIPIAERSSLMLDIGAWVIDAACAQARAWLDAGAAAPRIAVNVAARQIVAGDLDLVIVRALERHRLPACCLEVEITESMLFDQPHAIVAMLERVRALGVQLALDDFGTGYCNLGYLQRLPLDALKIDQSFVRTIGSEPDGAAIVDTIIDLAHRLRLRVVAEGVETEAQRAYLAARGCDVMQGFYFARPMPAADLAAWMRTAGEQAVA